MFHKASTQDCKSMVKNYTFTTEVVIDYDRIEASVIDVMIARFPHVVTDIFKELDNKTLTTCRNVSRLCCDYLDGEKILLIRMIQCRIESYRKEITYRQWNKALKNTPVKYVKELSVCTQQFFNSTTQRFPMPRSSYQWYPLQIVAEQGNLELFKHIFEKTKNTKPKIEYQSDLNTYLSTDYLPPFEYRWTPLHIAAKKGHEEICKFLIYNTEKKNPSDENGNTPLHYATERGLTNVCKLIIENVDNKNPAALNGCTPLHLAAKKGHLEIVRLIVETGVDKNTLYNGETPFEMARPFKSFTFYKVLSKDKFQLCGIFFKDLFLCFLMFFVLCSFLLFIGLFLVMISFLLFSVIGMAPNCDFNCQVNICHLGLLVISLIAFPLTIMIRFWLWFH